MSLFDENLKSFKRMRPQHINRRRGIIGRLDADGNLDADVTAGLAACYVWVRFGDDRAAAPVKNLRVENAAGMTVIVAENTDTRELEILGVDPITTPITYDRAAASLNSPSKGANIPTPVVGTDIVDGGLYPSSTSGGLYVVILPFQHINGYWTGETEKLLTPTTAAGKKALHCVGIDVYSNAYVEVLTQDRSIVYSSMFPEDCYAVIKACPTVYWVGAVELANGDTAINPSKVIDLRLWRVPTVIAQTAALLYMHQHFH